MADRKVSPMDTEQLKRVLLAREHARADAWMRKDKKALGALLAPDFVEVNTLGRFSRSDILERLFPALTLNEFIIESAQLQTSGDKAAVLSYNCREVYTMSSGRMEGRFHVTATYRLYDNQYRLSAWEIRPAT